MIYLQILEYKTIVGSNPSTIKRNQPLGELSFWGPKYQINVDLKINSWLGNKWGSILRFTADAAEGNCCKLGQRIPALWTKHGSNDKLWLVTNIDENRNKGFSLGNFEPGRWYNFLITQNEEMVMT